MAIVPRRHLEHFHHLGLRKYQECVLCFSCRQMILGHGTLWLFGPSTSSGEGQDVAELEMLEAELHKLRGYRRLVERSQFLFVMVAPDCVTDKILFWYLVNPCASMGIDAGFRSICEDLLTRMGSILFSIEPADRTPTLSRSGTEPSGEPKFEDNGVGEQSKEMCIASSHVRSLVMKTDWIHKNKESWVADTLIRRSKANLRNTWSETATIVHLDQDSSWAKMATDCPRLVLLCQSQNRRGRGRRARRRSVNDACATLLALKDSWELRVPWLHSVASERCGFPVSTWDEMISPTASPVLTGRDVCCILKRSNDSRVRTSVRLSKKRHWIPSCLKSPISFL